MPNYYMWNNFRRVVGNLESDQKLDSYLRWIFNNKNNNLVINEGYKTIIVNAMGYINQSEIINQDFLYSISSYTYIAYMHI